LSKPSDHTMRIPCVTSPTAIGETDPLGTTKLFHVWNHGSHPLLAELCFVGLHLVDAFPCIWVQIKRVPCGREGVISAGMSLLVRRDALFQALFADVAPSGVSLASGS
jgi:hypothetical protein